MSGLKEPVLGAEQAAEFAKSLADQPVTESPPSATPAVESEMLPAAAPETPVAPAAPEDATPVPRAQYLAEKQKYEADLAAAQSQIEERGRAQAIATLERIAVEHPELKEIIYGKQPPAEKPPEDPEKRELYDLKREVAEQKAWREGQERTQILDSIERRCETAMANFPEFKSKNGRAIGDQIIAHNVLAARDKTPEKIVEETALAIRAYQEEIKAAFKEGKLVAARTVPAGTGTGGAAPPGARPAKIRMEDGSARRALAQALEAAQKAGG